MAVLTNETPSSHIIKMKAPRPFFEVWTRTSTLYRADEEGIIEEVQGSDIQDLLNAGCSDSIPVKEVKQEQEQEQLQPQPQVQLQPKTAVTKSKLVPPTTEGEK